MLTTIAPHVPFLVRLPSNVVRSLVKAAPLRGVVKRSTGAAGARAGVPRRLRVLRVLRVLRPTDAPFRFGFGGFACTRAVAAHGTVITTGFPVVAHAMANAARGGTAFHSSRSATSALRETRPMERIPRSDVIVTP
jgi:hypothetical protein